MEWAPHNVLEKSSASEGDNKSNAAVGEHDVKRAILEQHLEGISDADIDPDRIEVWHMTLVLPFVLSLFPPLSPLML